MSDTKTADDMQADVKQGPKPRLMIQKMVLENFKSYAGKKEIGPFHKCFSSVVGPNGSGKSNVIDALLFVFGRRAQQIRLKKISELIHRSSNHPNLGSCSVHVHFCDIIDKDNDDDYTVVPNSEFVISRSANRKSQSKYHINHKPSTFTAVTDLLKSKGVDLDNNRFLILQGEVEQIAMMKPKATTPHEDGLLEYLEDIIGSNKYVEPIEEAFQKVEAFNDLRQEKLNRVKVVEKEKDALEGAKSEAMEFLRKELELVQHQSVLYQRSKWDCDTNTAEVEVKKTALQEELDAQHTKLTESTTKLEEMGANYKVLTKECDAVKKEMEKAKSDFQSFERKDIKYREDIKHTKSKLKKAQAAIKRNKKKKETLTAKNEDDQKEKPQLEKKVATLTEKLSTAEEALERIFETVKGKTEPIREKLEAKQKDMVPLRKDVNECQQQIDMCNSELEIFDNRRQGAADKLKSTEEELHECARAIRNKKKESSTLSKKISAIKKKLEPTKAEQKDLVVEESGLTKKRQKLLSQTAEARAALAASTSRNAIITNLMKAKKKGTLRGVQGRLGDLGAIDEKYDVAITTACPSLNAIVVDTTATGEECVKFLRKHKLGRAKFVLLDQMKRYGQACQKKVNPPENVPRLFDLITVKDDKYLPAFYWALRDTLVAKNLDQAVRIAFHESKRWRVVTLAGQVVDTSGTMSGGGKKVQRGGMSSRLQSDDDVDEKTVDALDQELKAAEAGLTKVRAHLLRTKSEVERLTNTLEKLELEQRKVDMELESLQERHAELESSLLEMKDQLEFTAEEKTKVKALKKQAAAHQKSLDAAQKRTEKLQREIDDLEQQIMKAGGSQLRTEKAKVDKLTKQLNDTRKAITKIDVDARNHKKKLSTCENAIQKAEKEVETLKASLEQMMQEFKQIEDDAVGVMQAFKEAEEHLKEKNKEVAEIHKEYEKMKSSVAKIRSAELDIQNQMDDFKRQIKENKKKADYWAAKIASVKNKIEERAAELADCGPLEADEEEEEEKKQQEQKEEKDDSMEVEATGDDEANKEDKDEDIDEKKADEAEEEEEEKAKEASKEKPPAFVKLSDQELADLDADEVTYKITMLEEALEHMKPNMSAIAEYRQKEREYVSRVQQLDKVSAERDIARKAHDALRKKRLDEFMAGFSVITMKLKEMYQMLTLGGDAELELVDSLDPFSEGIVFSVRPPKKSWKNIQNLSGGEKTLSSLALVFALHHYKPTPLYVMDEIDAALDFKNVSIVANYIKERTKNAQFVIISLRNNMFELADRLVGIYKTNDATKSITIDPRKFSVNNGSAAAPGPENAQPQRKGKAAHRGPARDNRPLQTV